MEFFFFFFFWGGEGGGQEQASCFRDKSGEWLCEAFASGTPTQQDKGFLHYARQLFFSLQFVSLVMFTILQKSTSAKEITLVT